MIPVDNKCLLLGVFTVFMYFMWMDITLWYHLQALQPSGKSSSPTPAAESFSVFHPITVKLLMTDPINHYVFYPACHLFMQATQLPASAPWLTPNAVSLLRLVVVLPSVRLLTAESVGLRQAGVAVVLLGDWMDALDGVLARRLADRRAVTSEVGKLGYYLDGVCDGVSTFMVMMACLVYLRRHPPRCSALSRQLPAICSKVEAEVLVSKDSLLGGSASPGPRVPVPPRALLATVLLFSGQLLLSSVGWNHAVTGYQRMLQNDDGTHTARQLVALKACFTWILMWFWRVFSFHSMLHCFMVSVVLNKTWEFLVAVRYIGYVALLTLIILCEVYLQTVVLYL